ncbi:MAG TPA: hypothetical protein VMW08_18935 [Acidimicrobiales bacterium]|nr:hypothetical protein [Acidimicrobiales bacterium]
MAKHRIHIQPSTALEVVNADLVIEVVSDDHKLGELRISRGTIDWAPHKFKTPISMSWETFDDVMRKQAS